MALYKSQFKMAHKPSSSINSNASWFMSAATESSSSGSSIPISIELESEAIKSFPVWAISLLPPENEIKISKILMEICLINNRITATNVLFNQLF
jgi:hypothetical protein